MVKVPIYPVRADNNLLSALTIPISQGMTHSDVAQPAVLNALLNAPWNILHEPPDVNMSVSEWHKSNRERARAEKA